MTDAVMGDVGTPKIDLQYDGRHGRFAKIVAVNLILQLLTLGIFRFWARTRERRYVWSHVNVGGDRLEYTGTGMELFIGFLKALVIIVPFIGIVVALNLVFGDSPAGMAIVQMVYILAFLFLIFVATYSARRYRLSRTLLRGIRGTLTGSALRYAVKAMGYYLLVMITAGLAAPLMRIALFRYEMENTHFGSKPFAFDGRARDLFVMWLVPWLGILAVIGAVIWLTSITAGFDPETVDYGDEAQMAQVQTISSQVPAILTVMGLGYLFMIFAYAWYYVREFRYLAGRTTFESMRFSSALGVGRVIWIYVSFILVAMLAGFLLSAVVGIAGLMGAGGAMDPDMVEEALTGAGSLLPMILGFGLIFLLGVLARVMIFHRMARAVVSSMAIAGAGDLSTVTQALDAAPASGEGLADAFDLGDF